MPEHEAEDSKSKDPKKFFFSLEIFERYMPKQRNKPRSGRQVEWNPRPGARQRIPIVLVKEI
jgi:hypothetical protein